MLKLKKVISPVQWRKDVNGRPWYLYQEIRTDGGHVRRHKQPFIHYCKGKPQRIVEKKVLYGRGLVMEKKDGVPDRWYLCNKQARRRYYADVFCSSCNQKRFEEDDDRRRMEIIKKCPKCSTKDTHVPPKDGWWMLTGRRQSCQKARKGKAQTEFTRCQDCDGYGREKE